MGLGLPVSKTITRMSSTYAWSVGSVRAFLLVAIIAAVIAVVSIFTATVTGAGASLAGALIAVALPALTGHASSLGSHGGYDLRRRACARGHRVGGRVGHPPVPRRATVPRHHACGARVPDRRHLVVVFSRSPALALHSG